MAYASKDWTQNFVGQTLKTAKEQGLLGSGGGEAVLGYEDYSTEEKVIGVWTDGRPIYRKAIIYNSAFTIDANSWFTTTETNSNKLSIIGAFVVTSTGTLWPFIGSNRDVGNYVQIYNNRNAQISGKTIVLEYTKTTDAANSFKPQLIASKFGVAGIGYENYSTDEVCIGKWMDGKPLYRKCLDWGYLPSNTTASTEKPIGINNIDNIIEIGGFGYLISGSNKYQRNIPYVSDKATEIINVYIKNNNICVRPASDSSNIYAYIYLSYTKTTDSANSFTPDMVYSGMIDSQTATDAEVTEVLS